MAYVFTAIDSLSGERVVLKTLLPEYASNPSVRERIYREAIHLARVRHPNIVRILDVIEQRSRSSPLVVLVLELIEGGTLEDRILAIHERGPLGAKEVRSIFLGLLSGLAVLHAHGVVHRDVKPSNVLLTRDGVPKLTDLGVALDATGERRRMTKQDARPGTPQYMAPEQIHGGPVTPCTDIYAAGLVLYEMLAGTPTFYAANDYDVMEQQVRSRPDLSKIAPRAPEGVLVALERALAKQPGHRFQTAMEFSTALAGAL